MKQRNKWIVLVLAAAVFVLCFSGCGSKRVKETDDITDGIDVARYQGTIDWETVADQGIDFAMVRIGYRGMEDGEIVEDSNARFNLQEASKYGIRLGAYFFSTAITEEEAKEEANWVADIIDQYPITYPVAYDCEMYNDPDSRQFGMDSAERTKIAMAFLKAIEKRGYEGMFYASKNEMKEDAQWQVSKLQKKYKIWVSQYPETPYPGTAASSYDGEHQMWQYTMWGRVEGIDPDVDRNVAYFGYKETAKPISDEIPEEVGPDVEALYNFEPRNEIVTAKIEAALRDIPGQGEDSTVLYLLQHGEEARRIAECPSGWSKVIYQGDTYYVATNVITTDLDYVAPPEYEVELVDDGINTRFVAVDEKVTPKIAVNLRTLPSTEHEDCKVVVKIKNGEVISRTGINEEVGWSRVVYKGQTLYCVSDYLHKVK